MSKEGLRLQCPEDVLGWIPWYGEPVSSETAALDARQRGAVEAHAAECAECRAELDMIAGAPFEIDVDLPDPDRVFEEISDRIEQETGERIQRQAPVIPIERGRVLDTVGYQKIADWLLDDRAEEEAEREAGSLEQAGDSQSTARVIEGPWGARPILAAAAAVLLVLLGGVGGSLFERFGGASGSTGADASGDYALAAAASSAPRGVDVIFVEDASASEISRALRGVGAEIVSGPSQMGVYRLVPAASRDSGAASAESETAARILAIASDLKALDDPIVVFAEPVLSP